MKIKSLKRMLWILNTVLVIGIVLIALKFFILDGKQSRQARAADVILGKLPSAKPDIKDDGKLLPVEKYRSIHEVVIDGELPPEPVETGPEGPVEHRATIDRDFTLKWTKWDPDPLKSFCHLVKNTQKDETIYLEIGEKIEGWKFVAVRNYEADFEAEDTGEKVTLHQARTAVKDPTNGGGTGPGPTPSGPPGPDDEPPPRIAPVKEAIIVRRSENLEQWEMPREEADWWTHWGEQEASEVALQPRKNPETGAADGIEVRKVKPGSMVAKRGVVQGDILKSINGRPVNTREEAIAYVKGEGKGLSRYVVVIERKGRLITKTYNVRQNR